MFIYLLLRGWKKAEREEERESQAGSVLSAEGSNPRTVRSWPWAETKSQTRNQLSHPGGRPLYKNMFIYFWERERERDGIVSLDNDFLTNLKKMIQMLLTQIPTLSSSHQKGQAICDSCSFSQALNPIPHQTRTAWPCTRADASHVPPPHRG